MSIKICPECGGKVASTRDDCVHCGYVFPKTKKCPECGEEVQSDLSLCPVCGHKFDDVIENGEETSPVEEAAAVEAAPVEETVPAAAPVEEAAPVAAETAPVSAPVEEEKETCPYCGSTELMPIGIGFYMCETCKARYLSTGNTSSSYTPSATLSAGGAIGGVVAPSVGAPSFGGSAPAQAGSAPAQGGAAPVQSGSAPVQSGSAKPEKSAKAAKAAKGGEESYSGEGLDASASKKLLILKIFVMVTALLVVISYATPYFYVPFGGIRIGFEYMRGTIFSASLWLTFIASLAAVALSIIPLAVKNQDGLNKSGKMHACLYLSVILSFLAILLNTIITCASKSADRIPYYGDPYSFVGLILLIPFYVVDVVLYVLVRRALSGNGGVLDKKSKIIIPVVAGATALILCLGIGLSISLYGERYYDPWGNGGWGGSQQTEETYTDGYGVRYYRESDGTYSVWDYYNYGYSEIEISGYIKGRVVKTIKSYAFSNDTSLVAIRIPTGITKICSDAFYGCTNLTEIYYEGTGSQWNQISKDSGWDYYAGNGSIMIMCCGDGTIIGK